MVAQTFDVPGTVTLRDVSRPAAGETAQQRAYRLASKAVISGVRICTERATGRQFATSATDASTLYAVDVAARTCDCRGFEKYGICSHLALALAQAGMLEPAAPVTCPACGGERGRKQSTGGRLSDWVWITCRRCHGAGTIN